MPELRNEHPELTEEQVQLLDTAVGEIFGKTMEAATSLSPKASNGQIEMIPVVRLTATVIGSVVAHIAEWMRRQSTAPDDVKEGIGNIAAHITLRTIMDIFFSTGLLPNDPQAAEMGAAFDIRMHQIIMPKIGVQPPTMEQEEALKQ